MLGLSIAISKMTNTWDMPTLCLVAVIAFVFGSTILSEGLSSTHNSRLVNLFFGLLQVPL